MALHDFRAAYLPYCLKKQKDGRYVPLNREYKPVGFLTYAWVNYEDYPVSAKIKGIGPALARKLSCHGSGDTEEIFLYHDGCNPIGGDAYMQDYLKKLKLLAKLRVE
jgi:hypothetical protein